MTIQREYPGGPFVAQCNCCTETVELEGDTRSTAIRDARDRGFRLFFEGRMCQCRHCSMVADRAAEHASLRDFKEAADFYEEQQNLQLHTRAA